MKRFGLWLGVATAVVGLARPARAAVDHAYLFSTFTTAPAAPTGTPFSINGTDGVILTLDGSGVATGQADISSPIPVDVQFPFTYGSHSGTLNSGEVNGTTASHINSELATLDDVGVLEEGSDAPLNVDFGASASLTLSAVPAGVRCVVVGEDAGLDVFKLEFDSGSGFVTLFNGFDSATQSAILGRSDFGTSDVQANGIDQFYVFIFDTPLPAGTFRITEIGNIQESGQTAGTTLEVDFAGACIPEPGTVTLVGISLGLMGMLLRRRS